MVEKILNCDPVDHYSILDVKIASADGVQQAYDNLRLQLQSDRNFAPRAAEALARVKRAYETLMKLYNTSKISKTKETVNISDYERNLIQRILSCDHNDYCSILNINRNATAKEAEKSFEYLGDKLHQNMLSGAERAFSLVNMAFLMFKQEYNLNKRGIWKENKYQEFYR